MRPLDRQAFAWLFLVVVPASGLIGLMVFADNQASIERNAPDWAVQLANVFSMGVVVSTVFGVFLASRSRMVASFLAAAVIIATGLIWMLVTMAFSNSWL